MFYLISINFWGINISFSVMQPCIFHFRSLKAILDQQEQLKLCRLCLKPGKRKIFDDQDCNNIVLNMRAILAIEVCIWSAVKGYFFINYKFYIIYFGCNCKWYMPLMGVPLELQYLWNTNIHTALYTLYLCIPRRGGCKAHETLHTQNIAISLFIATYSIFFCKLGNKR